MAAIILCDICDTSFKEDSRSHQIVELNGKSFRVFVDIDEEVVPDFHRLDICSDCRKQALIKIVG